MKSKFSFLTDKIIQARFGTLKGKNKEKKNYKKEFKETQNFDSIISTGCNYNLINELKKDELENQIQNEYDGIHTEKKTPENVLEKKTLNSNNLSFPPFSPSELQFLTWLHQNKNDATHFEKNKLIWYQFQIAVSQSECLIVIVDYRDINFYFDEDLFHLNKNIICIVNKVDLFSDLKSLLDVLESSPQDKKYSNKLIDRINKKTKFLKEQHNVQFLPFSIYMPDLNKKLENFLINSKYNSFSMIGYPNVGKSTIIKYLTSCKKIKISSTAGKTRYCQRYFYKEAIIEKENILNQKIENIREKNENKKIFFDIPGLVFKRHSLEQLIFNNVVNIDQIKINHIELLKLICSHVKLESIFIFFKINFRDFKKDEIDYFDEERAFHSIDEIMEYDRAITNLEELNYSILLDRVKNTFYFYKHWTCEIVFRKIIKCMFNEEIERK